MPPTCHSSRTSRSSPRFDTSTRPRTSSSSALSEVSSHMYTCHKAVGVGCVAVRLIPMPRYDDRTPLSPLHLQLWTPCCPSAATEAWSPGTSRLLPRRARRLLRLPRQRRRRTAAGPRRSEVGARVVTKGRGREKRERVAAKAREGGARARGRESEVAAAVGHRLLARRTAGVAAA